MGISSTSTILLFFFSPSFFSRSALRFTRLSATSLPLALPSELTCCAPVSTDELADRACTLGFTGSAESKERDGLLVTGVEDVIGWMEGRSSEVFGGGCDLPGIQSSSISKGFARLVLERGFAEVGGGAGLVKVGGGAGLAKVRDEGLVVRLGHEAPVGLLRVLLIFDGADVMALRGGFAGGRRVSRSSLSLSDVARTVDCCFAMLPRALLETAYDGVVGLCNAWVKSEDLCSCTSSSP